MAVSSACRNSAFGSPGGIGSRISTMIVPGRRMQAAPRPEHPRIERDRHAWHAKRVVEQHDAGLVVGRRAWGAARAFRKNDDLASVLDALLRLAQHAAKRAGPLSRSTGIISNLYENQPWNGIQNSSRFISSAGSRKIGNEREGLPGRLMLGGDEAGTLGSFSRPRTSSLVPTMIEQQTARSAHGLPAPPSPSFAARTETGCRSPRTASSSRRTGH